jgi:hypothetical protein
MPRNAPLVLLLAALGAAPVNGQVRPSQHGAVSQTVASTVVALEYDRPVARGRALWGDEGLIDYEALWTPGANRATWIDFSEDVTVEGHAVPAGRYGVWTIPREEEAWDVILVSEWDTHHTYFPFGTEVVRTPVAAVEGGHMETLVWYFPEVEGHEATLVMHWGSKLLPLRILASR